MNERLVLNVREVYVVDVYVSARVGQVLESLVGRLILGFQEVKNSACRGGCALKFCHYARDFVERLCVLRGVGKHARERADGKCADSRHYAAFYHQIHAQNAHDDVYDVVDESRAGIDHCRVERRVLSPNFQIAVDGCKSVLCAFFIAEQFDNALI